MTLPADTAAHARRDPVDVAARYAAPLFLVAADAWSSRRWSRGSCIRST